MENDLSYREFCSQFDAYFRRNEESFGSGKGEVRYRFFPKGFTAVREADMKFVRDTNMKYYQLESDLSLIHIFRKKEALESYLAEVKQYMDAEK